LNPLERASQAKEALANPAFKEAMHSLREEIVKAMEGSPVCDVDAHHHAAITLALLSKLKAKLERYVDDGKMEARKLEADKKRASLIQRFRA
jgi:hypothetical protein